MKSLTGLRGIAAFFVMLYHFTLASRGTDPLSSFVRKGYIWVDLFFVLSGFILALSFASAFSAAGAPAWRTYSDFLVRRFARIYPLYALVTAESAIVFFCSGQHATSGTEGLLDTVANFAMIQAWGLAPSFEGAAWSVSTEWAAYLVFPVLLAIALSRKPSHAIALGLVGMGTIIFLSATPGLHFSAESRMGPLDIYSYATLAPVARCLAEFSLGLLAYRLFRTGTRSPAGHRIIGCWSVALFAVILAAMTMPGTDPIIVALFPALIVAIAFGTGPVAWMLASAPAVWYGEISFSVYLVHGKFVHVIDWLDTSFRQRGWNAHPATVAASILLVSGTATVVHYTVERPCRVFLRDALNGGRVWQVGWRKAWLWPTVASSRAAAPTDSSRPR